MTMARKDTRGKRPRIRREPEPGTATQPRIAQLRRLLLEWGERNRRSFYWREPTTTAYGVLVTEILVARTRAESVDPVVRRLMDRFPTPLELSCARHTTVAAMLRPLGLHRTRARLLVRCARSLVAEHQGAVPESVEALMELSYVGRYAANAVASVAFDQPRAVLDANVARIYRRVFSIPSTDERLTVAEGLWSLADRVLSKRRHREFNWAMLDLGGTICTPRSPECGGCPLSIMCDARQSSSKASSA